MKYLVVWKNNLSGEQGAFYTQFCDSAKIDPEMEVFIKDQTRGLVSFDGGYVRQDVERNSYH